MEVTVNPKFESLWKGKTRYYIITGGRNSGKSFAISVFLSYLIYKYSGHRISFTRYTMKSTHDSIIPEFTEKLELLRILDAFEVARECMDKWKEFIEKEVVK